MNVLESQVAVVTGAARGAGKAIARRLASLGAHVLLVARNADQLSKVREDIARAGGASSALLCDLMNASAVADLGKSVVEKYSAATSGKQCRDWQGWKVPARSNSRRVGSHLQHQPPWSLSNDSLPRTSDDRGCSGHIINISSLAGDDIAAVVATLVTQPPQCFISEVLVRPTQKP